MTWAKKTKLIGTRFEQSTIDVLNAFVEADSKKYRYYGRAKVSSLVRDAVEDYIKGNQKNRETFFSRLGDTEKRSLKKLLNNLGSKNV